MNREILFRGKRLDNGEWVTGRLITDDRDGKEFIVCSIGYHWEEDNGSTNRCMECFGFEVDPETVGQYTGVNDCASVKIFEGDVFSDGSICVMFKTRIVKVWASGDWEDLDLTETQDVIIGNIHDNPELLEV